VSAADERERERYRQRESKRAQRARRRALGLCRDCDNLAGPVSRDKCEPHRVAAADHLRAHWARKLGVTP
jgi:hypothetical protein